MKKVINKGYTLTVVSWENDADYYQTKTKTVKTIEEAKAWYDLMQLCESENNQPEGVIKLGNAIDEFSEEQKEVIIDFLKSNPLLFDDNEIEDVEEYTDYFESLVSELLGHSDFYLCRVMESCTVTYSEKDVYLEEINFDK